MVTTPASSSTSSATSNSTSVITKLGQNDFLKLLIAQLQNQDPMQPTTDKEFIAQMAQFNSLDQLTSLNKNFTAFSSFSQLGQASSMLGKTVTIADSTGKEISAGQVTSVKVIDGQPVLITGNQEVDLSQVISIS